jgi:AhpD family alkylhydroperoxidase
MKELIAIGASVTANCVPCLRHHLNKAREAGVDDAKIQTAVSIGRMVRKGAASEWDEEAETLLGSGAAAGSTDKKISLRKAVVVLNGSSLSHVGSPTLSHRSVSNGKIDDDEKNA